MSVTISEVDQKSLQTAKSLLENPGVAVKITNMLGAPIEKGFELLPKDWNKNIGDVVQSALLKASDMATLTMKDVPGEESSNIWHKLGVAISGGVGGFFGVAALAIELPISTSIMLRSIADIARSEGESISDLETKQACLTVFALGGESVDDDCAESAYYAVRTALARTVAEASEFILKKKLADESAPVLIKLIASVAERFSIQITEKLAAQAVPAIGAAGGAIINTIFMDHFQDMAKGHFTVRRLERKYGREIVKQAYDSLPKMG